MIGFYDYTLILTLGSLISAMIGITEAIGGRFREAVLCMIISGICDGLDGKVARTKKDRSEDEKSFGVQLDSMCDMIAFCALPAVLCYMLSTKSVLSIIAVCYYGCCSVIRLSYYNMKEINRMAMEVPSEKVYYGLPITSSAIIVPTLVICEAITPETILPAGVILLLFVTGTCFILNFQIRRPGRLAGISIAAFFVILFAVTVFCTDYRETGYGILGYILHCIREFP